MAINSKRKAISYMVYGALPPHSTNVLWMDTSVPEAPILKIWWNGCWTPCHTDESKEIALLVETIKAQEDTIKELAEDIPEKINEATSTITGIDLSKVVKTEGVIPSCQCDWGNSIVEDDGDYRVFNEAVIPEYFGKGSIVSCETIGQMSYCVATGTTDSLQLRDNGEGRYGLCVDGATWEKVEPNKIYRCKDIVSLSTVVDSEPITVVLYIYEDPSITGVLDKIEDKSEEIETKVSEEADRATENILGEIIELDGIIPIAMKQNPSQGNGNSIAAGRQIYNWDAVYNAPSVNVGQVFKVTNFSSSRYTSAPILITGGDATTLSIEYDDNQDIYSVSGATKVTFVDEGKFYRCKEKVIAPSSAPGGSSLIYLYEVVDPTNTGILSYIDNKTKDLAKSSDIPTDYAKQGGNASANISDIQALIGYTITEIDSI